MNFLASPISIGGIVAMRSFATVKRGFSSVSHVVLTYAN